MNVLPKISLSGFPSKKGWIPFLIESYFGVHSRVGGRTQWKKNVKSNHLLSIAKWEMVPNHSKFNKSSPFSDFLEILHEFDPSKVFTHPASIPKSSHSCALRKRFWWWAVWVSRPSSFRTQSSSMTWLFWLALRHCWNAGKQFHFCAWWIMSRSMGVQFH